MSKEKTPVDPNNLIIESTSEEVDANTAKAMLSPSTLAAISIKRQYQKDDTININALNDELSLQAEKVRNGDLTTVETMLISQAHTLDSLFADMIARARMNMGEYFNAAEKYMKLGLKAQSQCRTTLEALAEIKNPKPYIQNNKAQYQQVNNGTAEPHAHGENSNRANELLEDKSNEWLDTGAPETASGNDKELEAVEAKHRAED